MKIKMNPTATMVLSALVLSAIFGLNSCKKEKAVTPITPVTPVTTNGNSTAISLIGLKSDSGFSYKIGYDLDVNGDSPASPNVSTMRVFENGVELGPAHANHSDIRRYGLGQFSHWENTLYFSTSDNSNPLTNGRKYTYTMQ